MAESASTFTTVMEDLARAFEVLGALVLIAGAVVSAAAAVHAWRHAGSGRSAYTAGRQTFGGTLLLALEVLVAADLIRTVAVAPTLDNVLVLGLIVIIRTVLSFSLETEIEGVPPWRRATLSGAATLAAGIRSARGQEGQPTDGSGS